MAESIVIIPARSGSKRFPRKNVAPLLGRPLLSYAIAAGLRARSINGTIVSTDDPETADLALEWGAEVPCLRPAEFATDHATADQAVAHMVRHLITEQNRQIGIVVLIQPTSPFVLPAHIDSAIRLFSKKPELESVTTLAKLDHRLHPYNLCQFQESDTWEFIFPEERKAVKTRQSKPPTYQFANLFAARSETFLECGRFGATKGAVVVDDVFAWDVDHEWQLKVAEHMLATGIVNLGNLPEKKSSDTLQ